MRRARLVLWKIGRPPVDARILAYYGEEFDESARLATRSAQGPLELERTLAVIRGHLPGGRVIDIGGGTGQYALALMQTGCDVTLVDPVPRHVEEARRLGVAAVIGDARRLPFAAESFDAALLLGPLYHLAERDDRLLALREAARVTRAGGLVFAAAISRFIRFASFYVGAPQPERLPPALISLLSEGTPQPDVRFPAGHFHTAEELEEELASAGLAVMEVLGIEGPAGVLLETLPTAPADVIEAARTLARASGAIPGIRDFSAHLLGVAQVHKS